MLITRTVGKGKVWLNSSISAGLGEELIMRPALRDVPLNSLHGFCIEKARRLANNLAHLNFVGVTTAQGL